MPSQNPDSPQSVLDKVAAILDQFSFESSVLSLDKIVLGSGVRRSTAHRLLQNLVKKRYVRLVDGGYALGIRLFELGMVAKQTLRPIEMLDDILQTFLAGIQETLIVALLQEDELTFIHVIEPRNPLRYVVSAGERRSAQWGATGLAILSTLNESERVRLAQPSLEQFTAKTEVDLERWLDRIKKVERRGYAATYGEYFEGISAIAIPLNQELPMSLAVVGPEERMQKKEKAIIAGLFRIKPNVDKLPLWTIL